MKIARIGILEDDMLIREHLSGIVASAPDYELVGTASTIAAARDLLVRKQPDLFLVDVGLPDGSGIDFIANIKKQGSCKVLMITGFSDRETVVRAVEAGADGYLLKNSSPGTILEGIAATLDGGAPVSPAAATFLLERLQNVGPQSPDPDNPDAAPLTPREVDLLKLFARGMSYKEAARKLDISPLTVGNHVKSIYRKLAVHSRGEAVYAAVRKGQLKLD